MLPQIFDTVDLHFLREVRAELAARGLANITRPDDVMAWMNTTAPVLASEGDERVSCSCFSKITEPGACYAVGLCVGHIGGAEF